MTTHQVPGPGPAADSIAQAALELTRVLAYPAPASGPGFPGCLRDIAASLAGAVKPLALARPGAAYRHFLSAAGGALDAAREDLSALACQAGPDSPGADAQATAARRLARAGRDFALSLRESPAPDDTVLSGCLAAVREAFDHCGASLVLASLCTADALDVPTLYGISQRYSEAAHHTGSALGAMLHAEQGPGAPGLSPPGAGWQQFSGYLAAAGPRQQQRPGTTPAAALRQPPAGGRGPR